MLFLCRFLLLSVLNPACSAYLLSAVTISVPHCTGIEVIMHRKVGFIWKLLVTVPGEEQTSGMPVLASSCASSDDGVYLKNNPKTTTHNWAQLTPSYWSIVVPQLYPALCISG